MSEVIKYGLIGKEDLRLGTGTFKATLADGREVTLTMVDMCDLGSAQSVTGVKTMASPVLTTPSLTSPAITGTVTGGASYTSPTLTSPTISGTTAIGNGATITTPTIAGPTAISGNINSTGKFIYKDSNAQVLHAFGDVA